MKSCAEQNADLSSVKQIGKAKSRLLCEVLFNIDLVYQINNTKSDKSKSGLALVLLCPDSRVQKKKKKEHKCEQTTDLVEPCLCHNITKC